MKRRDLLLIVPLLILMPTARAQKAFTLHDVMAAPFPNNLTAAKTRNRVAWTLDQEGLRNVWVAEGPEFAARRLTKYDADDGQALSELRFSVDANTLVYVRGEGKNAAGQSPNPTSNPGGAEQVIWAVPWSGGEAKKVDAGHSPEISTRGTIAYIKDDQVWVVPLDGADKPQQLEVRGRCEDVQWSPDGSRLAFVSARGDHALIGVYSVSDKVIRFLTPSVDSDRLPRWSPDGTQIAFVRKPASPRDAPEGFFVAPDKPDPWAIWIADASGRGREIWHSGKEMNDSYPDMAEETGGGVLNWAADNRLVVASEMDGWQHLYSISAQGGTLKLLTPGSCEVEQWSFTPRRDKILFNSNCEDIDRRHLWDVSVTEGKPARLLTGSEGIEWSPVSLSDGTKLAFLGSDATHPGRPFLLNLNGTGKTTPLAAETWPQDFPADRLVTPQQVNFTSNDGVALHAQLFVPRGVKPGQKRPAVIFLHGGPMRQMLLGWHYMYYYSNRYAMNQYLASRGYIVLALNYRSGIGYGRTFHVAPGRAGRGATEYRDVVAAGMYLRGRGDVDVRKIGLWGGSYGGFLTALGLARNSDVFAAGVDLHGVHDWPTDNWDGKNISPELKQLAHDSSPVTAVMTWRSPVLFIHGDDDRNVYFTQTVDLVARLREHNVEIEQLIFPDEVHDFLLHRNWLQAYQAASDFFDRHFHIPVK